MEIEQSKVDVLEMLELEALLAPCYYYTPYQQRADPSTASVAVVDGHVVYLPSSLSKMSKYSVYRLKSNENPLS